jgi:hypothetical protein
LQVLAIAPGAQHRQPGARQHDRRHRQKREQRAAERDLAERVGRELPFDDRIAAGEHHRRGDHIGDAARDLVAPRRQHRGLPRLGLLCLGRRFDDAHPQ